MPGLTPLDHVGTRPAVVSAVITICPCWTPSKPHPPKVMREEQGEQPGVVSHGMCEDCKAEADRLLLEEEKKREKENDQA